MANHASPKKRIKTDKKKHLRNVHFKSMMKTSIKRVKSAENKESADVLYRQAVKLIDKIAAKGIIHKNRAASHKSKLTRFVNSLS